MAALAALGVRMALDPILGSQAPYIPFIIAIVVASRYGGRGPGLAATAISGLSVDWFYLQPRNSLALTDLNEATSLALFVLSGVIISLFVGRLRESLLSAARAEPAPRQTEEQISLWPGSSMASRGPGRKLKPHYLWLGAAVLLVAIEALLFLGTWTRFSERESLSIRAREVLAKIESLFSELKDAETGQRGYLLTGRDYYLEPYNTAVREIPGQLEDLRKLTLDPGQQARTVSLRPLISAKLAELKETIDLRRTGAAAAALQVLSSDRGKQTMDQIRDTITAMQAAEASLLNERSQRAAAAAKGMGFVMASGAGLLLIVLLAGSRDIDRNLTRRQQAQEELRESEAQFRTLANAIPQLCWMANADGWIFWYNERWYGYTGTTPEQMEGWGWQSVHDPEALPGVLERWKVSIAESLPFDMVFPLRGADGVFRPFLTRVMPVRGHDGKVARWFGTNTDISAQKQAEAEVRKTRDLLETFIKSAPVALAMFDRNMRCIRASDQWLRDTAAGEDREILGKSHYEIFPDMPAHWKGVHQRGMAGETVRAEDDWVALDGKTHRIRWEVHPWGDSGTETGGIIIAFEDITERRRADEALRAQAALLDLAYDAIIVRAEGDKVAFWSAGAEETYGWTRQEAMGRFTYDLLKTRFPKPLAEIAAEVAEKGRWEGELVHTRKDGGEITVASRWAAQRDAEGRQVGILEINRDITDRKQAEEALRASESRLRTLGDNLPEGALYRYRVNADGRGQVEFISAGIERMTGVSAAEYMADVATVKRYILPEDHDRFDAAVAWSRDRLAPVEVEVRHRHRATGEIRWSLMRSTPSRSADGSTVWDGIELDITGRKRAEQAVAESRAKLDAALASMTDAVFISDTAGTFVEFNDAFATFHRFGSKEECARTLAEYPDILDVYFPDGTLAPLDMWAVSRALRGETVGYAEYILRRKDTGETWWGGYSFGPIRDKDGAIVGSVVVGRDITDRKRAEEALRESEARFRRLYESGMLGVIFWNMNGAILDANDKFLEMTGYDRDDLAASRIDWVHMTPPEYQSLDEASIEELKTTGVNAAPFEKEYIRKDGSRVPVIVTGAMLDDARFNGVALAMDIAERKRAEEALLRMSAIVESSDDAIIGKTLEGVITSWNLGAARLYGYTGPEIIGRHISALVPAGHPDELAAILRRVAKGERVEQIEAVRRRKDGSLVDVSLKISPIVAASGNVVGASTIARDITGRKRAEEEIRRLNADLEDRVRRRTSQLEAANKELEAFAYSVSHDLRTPLRGIDGWSLALVEDYASQLDERAHGYLDRVRAETQRMGQLIDDLLQLSRVTRSEMATGVVDLTSIAQTIAAGLSEINSGRRIEFTIAGGLAATGDARLLEIALSNLFANAVKFTGPRAEARIEFGRTERDGKGAFYVRDNGVGFEMAFAGTLFGAFQRLHKSSEFPGTGIGLATVQRIIHRHGGCVWAEAQPDRGATFYFTLGES